MLFSVICKLGVDEQRLGWEYRYAEDIVFEWYMKSHDFEPVRLYFCRDAVVLEATATHFPDSEFSTLFV
jgi:hypothetical protein